MSYTPLTLNHDASEESIYEYVRNMYRGTMRVETLYVRNGDVYVHIVPTSSYPHNPPDFTVLYRWVEEERDVDGIATRMASLLDVCTFSTMTGGKDWIDEKAEKDHEGWNP